MRDRLINAAIVAMVLAAIGIAGAAAYFTVAGDPFSNDDSASANGTPTPAPATASLTPVPTPTACPTAVPLQTIPSRFAPPGGGPRAAILDEASLTAPNQAFAEAAMALLQQAGYVVDYYSGHDVTVDTFRSLPDQHYAFIIFRGHSAALFDDLVLFTNEPYSDNAHEDDQRGRRLVEVHWNAACVEEPRFFGIMPAFIRDLDGDFAGATVLITGCWSLDPDSTAAAFVEKGAKEVVGWDGFVTADHTDAATEQVLRHLLVDRLSTAQAVTQTSAELGPDPAYDSNLRYYPPAP